MANINVGNLELQLVQKINASLDPFEIASLTIALKELRMGVINVVNSFSLLPDATANEGKLYYVVLDRTLYFAKDIGTQIRWVSIGIQEATALWTWGGGTCGQLGDGTTIARCSPGTTAGGGTTWSLVSLSFTTGNGSGLKSDGTLWTWGCAGSGVLGDGIPTNRSSPGTTAGGGTNWCDISMGGGFALAVKEDGTLWSWGCNSNGALGDGTTTNRSSPVTTAGGGTNWCVAAAGFSRHSSAIKTDGTLWTWGCAKLGALGDGTTINRSSPGTTEGGGTTWCALANGLYLSSGVKTDGTLWTWGEGSGGGLGDGTTASKTSPVTTAGGGTNWCKVRLSNCFGVATKEDGTLWTWGCGTGGRLGDGTCIAKTSPVTTAGGGTNWLFADAKANFVVAVKTDGTLWTWGQNSSGTLGLGTQGTATNRASPGTTLAIGSNWCNVSGGASHTAAIESTIIS